MSKLRAIAVDLDGTLCNIDHRLHLLKEEGDHWSKFFSSMAGDSVNKWCKTLIDAMAETHIVLLVSGRPDNYRNVTEGWLLDNDISYNLLFMRKSGDRRPDNEVKKEIYELYIKKGFYVEFVVDDRTRVVNQWRELGLVCLQCAEGNY